MRVVVFLIWAVALVAMVVTLFRRRALGAGGGARPALRDELVKDPVCHTYVVRSRAVSRGDVEFCSAECAARYTGR
jgi:hypothetical protein